MPPVPLEAEFRYGLFVTGLRRLLLRWPASVTSWWRTPDRNAANKDAIEDSQHLVGTAADLVFDPGAEPVRGLFIAAAREEGLEALFEGDHWHLELVTHLY